MKIGVALHTSLRYSQEEYLIKELWGQYIERVLAPHFDEIVLASVIEPDNAPHPFQTYRLMLPNLKVVSLADLRFAGNLVVWLRSCLSHLRQLYQFSLNVDVIWIFMPTFRAFMLSILARLLKRPYIAYIGGDWANLPDVKGLSRWVKLLLERAVVQGSRFTLVRGTVLSLRYPEYTYKIFQAVPAIQITLAGIYQRELSWPFGKLKCLYVGGLHSLKGISYLIDAIRLLIDKGYAKLHLDIVGIGNEEASLRKQIMDLGLNDFVTFHGYVPNGSTLFDIYKKADVFILPTMSEGFPRVLIEAVAFGLAVITTSVGGIPDIMVNGKNCLFVPIRSSVDIADALERLLNDQELYYGLVENGYQTARELLKSDAPTQMRDLMMLHHLL